MSINILDLAKSYFTSAIVDKMSGIVGENSSDVQKAMESVLPSLLGGIMQKASTTSGANEILNLASENKDETLLADLSAISSNSIQSHNLLSLGSRILPLLFGSRLESISDSISAKNGIKRSSATSLLSIAAPILITVISKHIKSSGIGISGLTSLLMGQKESVLAGLPAGVLSALNFTDLGDFKGDRKQIVEKQVEEVQKSERPTWVPWLIGGLIVLAILWGMKTCRKEELPMEEETEILIDSAGSSSSEMSKSTASKIDPGLEALGKFFTKKLPNGVELNIPEFGIENKLVTFIEDANQPIDKTTWFNFDRINFKTGSAKLSSESLEQTKNIADILKAFPTATLKIGGYTDNTGDPAANLNLSLNRAEAVKAAIVTDGIEARRLDAEGYGKEHPIASNDTDEGKAQNRRIAIRVLNK